MPPSAARMRAIDLFSGCGGLSLGLERAGFDVIGAVEIDSLAVETYGVNHPDVHVWHRDIRDVSVTEVRCQLGIRPGELELLAGCPPCQGFSAMRCLNGARRVHDKRNELIFEFLRFVRGLRPRAIMLENVPGLARNARLRKFRDALRKLGYTVAVEVKDAQHYGVPQRRRRLILVGCRGAAVPFARYARHKRTVRDAFRKLTPQRAARDALHKLPERHSPRITEMLRRIPKDGGSRADLGKRWQLECHRRCDGFKDVYGRMCWSDVAPTITGGCCNPSKGRFLHPSANRTITLREAALLQSFPPTYYFSLRRGKYPAAEMIGNALPPEFIRRQALEVAKVLRDRSSRVRGV